MAVLPADHYIAQTHAYRKIVATALNVAREPGRMVVLGIPPTRPETGFGYIERTEPTIGAYGIPVYPVHRFAENRRWKPQWNIWLPEITSGTRGCFFGGCRPFSTSCRNICREP